MRGLCILFVVLSFIRFSEAGNSGQKGRPLRMEGNNLVIETKTLHYEVSRDGKNAAFVDRATGRNYADPGQPFMFVTHGGRTWAASNVELAGDAVTVTFGESRVQLNARLETRETYFTITVEHVSGGEADRIQFCNLPLAISDSIGTLVNGAWNKEFAVCAFACNDWTESYAGSGTKGHLCARCHREFGFEGAKIAVIGVPQPQLMDAIGKMEIEQGLPHPVLNGVWIKRSPKRFASYLMVHGLGEANVDQVIELAKGGFGCIEIYPWRSTPSYGLNPSLFPHGMDGLKKVADKIHAAGLQLGLHCMQGMVGWGPKDDPYIVPKADPRLLQDRRATLAAALDANATEIFIKEETHAWPEKGDLYIEGEIIRYGKRTGQGFAECQRGLHGTTITAHPAGAQVGRLVNCFPIWGGTVYCPDVNSTMIDEICDRIADVFNATGADMSYFDGGEELAVQPPHWRNQGRIALGVMRRLKKPVILGGNALYTNLSWHVITRGSPHYDPIYFGRRDFTLRFKGQNPAHWAKNLLTGDVGWFCPHTHSLTTDACTPDEVLLLCLKALGGKAPISFSMDAFNPWVNRRMPEMLDIIRTCDELKRLSYFSDEICAEITKPGIEHTLERTSRGEWVVRPLQFGPPRVVDAQRPELSEWTYTNPHGEQTPWVRIRARAQVAPYGAKENIVLADFTEGVPISVKASSSPELVQTIESSSEKAPDGASTFCYRADNRGKAASRWCEIGYTLPKPVDLSHHRRLGVWIRSEGKGGILNIQLAATYCRRDHYIPLTFTGWSYRVLDPPEDARFWEYAWPYSFTDLMYTVHRVYSPTQQLNLYFNALPANSMTSCWISRIEALNEKPVPLRSPVLEVAGKTMLFPGTLKPDEYLEMDWHGRCRHLEPNGGVIEEVNPEGILQLASGENIVRFSCDINDASSSRAEVTLAVKGKPLPNVPARTKAGRVSRVVSRALGAGEDETVSLASDGKGGFRFMQGLFELVGSEPPRTASVFDGHANVWSVTNDQIFPRNAAIAILRGAASQTVDYDNPKAVVLETFDDLTGYEMSDTNQFEKYVIGGGKQLTQDGPVRESVSQTFVPSSSDSRSGRHCGVYTASNNGGPGGWCAKGKRFPRSVDLSACKAVAFWLHGDGKRETLRFQFRDVEGRHADWLVPIDFVGWKLQVFRTADIRNFDWRRTEYLIFYFNDLPEKMTCTMKFDDVKALPQDPKPAAFTQPAITVNEKKIRLPVSLHPEEGITLDSRGRCTLWRPLPGKPRALAGSRVAVKDATFLLQPGINRIELSCDTSNSAPRDVTVRVVQMRPVRA